VDGGIIGNNPATYSYLLQSKVKQLDKPIRVLSLGTGVGPAPSKNADDINRMVWTTLSGEFTIDADAYVHDRILAGMMALQKENSGDTDGINYIRM